MEPQLRTPNYPDQILEDAAAVKIRQYRNPYRHHRMPTPRSAKLERACAKHFFQPLCGPAVAMQHTQLCAQISELEPIITVRGPHSQHMFSAANAPLCNIRERKQCNLLSNFPAPHQLCGTRSCGKCARKGNFQGQERTWQALTGGTRSRPATARGPRAHAGGAGPSNLTRISHDLGGH
jgi:hypothetical protein